jgi:threonine/homoserine/homoserine lactone efflux protein
VTEHLITISVIGLVAGFIFSMPIAGPISILVTSNALKGKLRYCNLLAIGSSLADFIYVLLGVYGITHFFTEYKGLIPYILGAGSVFVFYIGIKIIRTKLDTEHIEEEAHLVEQQDKKHKGAFYTGFMINLLNPTLFFGWLVSSFVILSFAASLGFDTGGLNESIDKDLTQIEKADSSLKSRPEMPSYIQFDTLQVFKRENRERVKPEQLPQNFHLLVSTFYSAFLSAGSMLWFILLAVILSRFRKRIDIRILNWVIRILGIVMCFSGLFFAWSAVKMLL